MKLLVIFLMLISLQCITLQAGDSFQRKPMRDIQSLEIFLKADPKYCIVRRQDQRVNALTAFFVVQEIPPSVQSLAANIYLDFEQTATGICLTWNYSGSVKVVQINRLLDQQRVNINHLDKALLGEKSVHLNPNVSDDDLKTILHQLEEGLKMQEFMHPHEVILAIKHYDSLLAV